ncbi:MAG: hypothetical protein JKX98_12355 [Alcanivoracaceae bacterium]|nr:hypothetical protein [Alcanivoracaceae bacterium]
MNSTVLFAEEIDKMFLATIVNQVETEQPKYCNGGTMICLNGYYKIDFEIEVSFKGTLNSNETFLDSDHYGYPFDIEVASKYLVIVGKSYGTEMVLKDIPVFETLESKHAITGMSAINKLDISTCHKLLLPMFFKGMGVENSYAVSEWEAEELKRYSSVIKVVDDHVLVSKGILVSELGKNIDYNKSFNEDGLLRCSTR